MKKKIAICFILCACAVAVICLPFHMDVAETVKKFSAGAVIVIDPGHGGMDGGAESADGTSEKMINLNIGRLVKSRLEHKGMKVIMTRSADEGLYDSSEAEGKAIRTLKTEDMKARKEIIADVEPDLTVSIHLNSFTEDSSVKGAQVFYPGQGDPDAVKDSELAAGIVQDRLNKSLNGSKARHELEKNDVFLLKNVTSPIIIAECGFLSNPDEAARLKSQDYCEKVAGVIADGICAYVEKTSETP